ncbi:MAG TPA: hypothetical protein PLD88_09205, partial [Candidatus Berkiella sp.]|nr:hypothetical protein [Candidatus Berkiella sp.]
YGSLARTGKVMSLSYLANEPLTTEHSLFSPLAAKQVSAILNANLDLDHPFALKTGTSYGYRDVWVIGYDQRYVIGIWTGIPDGKPMAAHSARELVVPLLQKIIKVLPDNPIEFQSPMPVTLSLKKSTNRYQQEPHLHHNQPILMFPVDDTVVELVKAETEGYKALPLSVSGGKRPYTWLIDGKPIKATSWRQKTFWQPQEAGYYTITVVDANGQVDRANIELK